MTTQLVQELANLSIFCADLKIVIQGINLSFFTLLKIYLGSVSESVIIQLLGVLREFLLQAEVDRLQLRYPRAQGLDLGFCLVQGVCAQ